MDLPVIVLLVTFIVFLALNVPIAVSIGLATLFTSLAAGQGIIAFSTTAQRVSTGIEKFALLAIPFFILSGILMGKGGIARRLIAFADAVMGRFNGGLGYVNVLTCMLFGSISGSAAAAVSSVGGFIIPEMKRAGYEKNYSVAITTTAATTGLMIPPSNIMIVYAVVSNVSIAAMFMAGILPGILTGLFLMVANSLMCKRRGYGAGDKAALWTILVSFKRAFLSLLLVFIVLGGILSGIFTATEAAAIAVVYSFVLSVIVYREVKLRDIPEILVQCAVTTGIVMLLVGTSMAMSWILSLENIPQMASATLIGISEKPIVIFLIINALLLVVGTFMDMTPAVLIFTPIFLPVVRDLGMHPVHFGLMLIANLCIGLCTPPVGTCLFVGCGVGGTSITKVVRPLIPFFIAMVLALLVITYWPPLSLWLPRLLDLI